VKDELDRLRSTYEKIWANHFDYYEVLPMTQELDWNKAIYNRFGNSGKSGIVIF